MFTTRADSQSIGQSLLQRMGVRDREKLQVEFLRQLAQTPLSEQLVLRGGVALHGVWLHGRCSKDLDFLATPEVAERFLQIAETHGFRFESAHERQMFGRMYTLARRGQVFSHIAIGIDLCPREATNLRWEQQEFVALSGERVPVRVLPLAEQVAEKLRACMRRKRELDFYDVWLALSRFPYLSGELTRLLELDVTGEARLVFHAEDALTLLDECRESWFEKLAPQMAQVPSFQVVRRDLGDWLSCLPQTGTRWPLALVKEFD